jgi:hypothetical protein
MAGNPGADYDSFLYYYRSQTGKEIDFVAKQLGDAALESKYIETGRWAAEAKTLEASQWSGVFATRSILDIKGKGTKVWAVPASILAYLLDT